LLSRNRKKEPNIVYCAPARVIAAGADRNQVQAAIMSPQAITEEELIKLEKIQNFAENPGKRVIVVPNKRIAQAGLLNFEKIEELERVLGHAWTTMLAKEARKDLSFDEDRRPALF
jgi:hypothetical protein